MHIIPQKREEWFGLVLFPFKAYVPIAFVLASFYSSVLQGDAVTVYLLLGDFVSFVVLVVAAGVQFMRGQPQSAVPVCAFACLALTVGLCLLPLLAR